MITLKIAITAFWANELKQMIKYNIVLSNDFMK